MINELEEALQLFGISSGYFSKEQLLQIRDQLLKDPNKDKKVVQDSYDELSFDNSIYVLGSDSFSHEKMISIEEKLARLICDYIKSNRLTIEEFIYNLVETIVQERELSNYVKAISFGESSDMLASYLHKRIRIFKSSFEYFPQNKFYESFSSEEKEYYWYINLFLTIAHEIEHANQRKIKKSDENSVKQKIIIAADYPIDSIMEKLEVEDERLITLSNPIQREIYYRTVYLAKNLKYLLESQLITQKYNRNWHFSPKERMADIYSYLLTISVVKHLERELGLQNIYNYLHRGLFSFCFAPYLKNNNPTGDYLRKFKLYSYVDEINDLSKDLTPEERFAYGLDISNDELNVLKDNKMKALEKMKTLL